MEFRFSMNTCQFCVGHSHCNQCGEELAERLLASPFIQGVETDMGTRTMKLDTSLEREEVEDFLEERGVFIL